MTHRSGVRAWEGSTTTSGHLAIKEHEGGGRPLNPNLGKRYSLGGKGLRRPVTAGGGEQTTQSGHPGPAHMCGNLTKHKENTQELRS